MKVFISHAPEDEPLAKRVAAVLKESGFEVWDPDREIMPGDNWAEKVAQALQESNAMVVLLTPDALQSKWVLHEIEYALGAEGYSQRLIPVAVGGTEKLLEKEIPWILRRLNLITLAYPGDDKGLKQVAQALSQAA